MRAKSFFNACLGVLALALAYHLGASTATAQAPGNPVVASLAQGPSGGYHVVTANGNVYGAGFATGPWNFETNVFAGGPTPAQSESMGSVKVRYR